MSKLNLNSGSEAVFPSLGVQTESKLLFETVSFVLGLVLLVGCSQIVIPLPFTPVPVTGQTFGVALVSLLWGRKRAGLQVGSYLFMGFSGLPIFATGLAGGLTFGPTLGYLVGMLVASQVIGTLADRGWAKSLTRAVPALMLGSSCTLGLGYLWLAHLMGYQEAFVAGVLPFFLGDAIKTLLAASIAVGINFKASKSLK